MIDKCLECKNYNMCDKVMTLCEELEEPWYSELKYFEPIEEDILDNSIDF